ncbi:MAG: DEAD/DEAH box helicase [Bacteroidales bacterium]|nr:DEAD/DEAH box helicase [Bacteroidales bacterium]
MESQNNIEKLHPKVLRWIWQQGWQGLKPIQENSIEPIMRGDTDVVISASTAGGKTEAAYLPILSRLLSQSSTVCYAGSSEVTARPELVAAPNKPMRGFKVLSLSPLKSLINDQTRRLEDMTRYLGIEVTPWHGDVAQSRKQTASKHPDGILVTTPESLEAMMALKAPWLREAFAPLQYIVIDELHSFLGSERGKQLQSLLDRLELVIGRKIPRIAMSATFRDFDYVKKFLRPDRALPCALPDAGSEAHQVQLSVKEYIADATHDPEPLIAKELFARLRGTNNLVFTNSRKDAEAYMVALTKESEKEGVPNEFRIHHGSLSRHEREAVEKDLQRGHHPVTAICTASMELGVDIGKVKSIAQVGTAGSPSTLRQRLGRSGRRGEPSILRIYSVDEQRDDYKFHLRTNLVQNIAVTELLRQRRYDPPMPEMSYVSVIVQQLVSLLSQFGSFYATEAYDLLCNKGAFGFMTKQGFADLLKHLGKKKVISQLQTGQLVIGTEGERMLAQRDFYSAFTTPKDYTIIDSATHKTVGSVQYKPYYGEVFILAGAPWIVDSVEEKSSTVYASSTFSKGKMMFEGTGIETSPEVTLKMLDIYKSDEKYPYLDASTATAEQLEAARAWFRKMDLGNTPYLRHGDSLSFFTWGGMRVNRTIAALSNRLLHINPPYDHIALNNLGVENIEDMSLMTHDIEDVEAYAADLASDVNRVKKERGKWDQYLPDNLLNAEYASTRFDLPTAQKILGDVNKKR